MGIATEGLWGGTEEHGDLSSLLKIVGERAGDLATDLMTYNLSLQKNFFRVYEFYSMNNLSSCADGEHKWFGYRSLLN